MNFLKVSNVNPTVGFTNVTFFSMSIGFKYETIVLFPLLSKPTIITDTSDGLPKEEMFPIILCPCEGADLKPVRSSGMGYPTAARLCRTSYTAQSHAHARAAVYRQRPHAYVTNLLCIRKVHWSRQNNRHSLITYWYSFYLIIISHRAWVVML